MFFEALFDIVSHFPAPDFSGVESPILLVAKVRIPVSLFFHLGGLALPAAGTWATVALYLSDSEESALRPDPTGHLRAPASSAMAAGIMALSANDNVPPVEPGGEALQDPSAVPEPDRDSVSVSVFAPPAASPGDDFYIQVFLHSRALLADALELAKELEGIAQLFKSRPLRIPLKDGDEVRVTIEGRGVDIMQPDQTFVWRGYLSHLAFAARLPANLGERQYKPLIRLFVNGAPQGIISLEFSGNQNAADAPSVPVAEKVLRFSKVFISYASADREKVLDMAKMLRAQRIDFFQDVLSLEPGQRWERQIYKEIENCDAFYLFWSSNASRSEWVVKEALLALECQERSGTDRPHFMPIIIEGPPIPKPPPELSKIHFDDPLQHMILAAHASSSGFGQEKARVA